LFLIIFLNLEKVSSARVGGSREFQSFEAARVNEDLYKEE
jgi:hypothetical protein